MAKKAPTPSEVFADRMREIREVQRRTQQDLADQLRKMGENYDRATIARMETRKRTISLDEALMLSAALGVSPLHMFVPLERDELVRLAAKTNAKAFELEMWVQGYRPLFEDQFRTWLEAHSNDELAVISRVGKTVMYLREMVAALEDFMRTQDLDGAERALDDIQELSVDLRQGIKTARRELNTTRKRPTREEG